MKEMQERAYEPNTVENDKLDTASLLIEASSIGLYWLVNGVSRDENVILYAMTANVVNNANHCERIVNIVAGHSLVFDFVHRDDILVAKQSDLHISRRASLTVGGVVSLKRERAFASAQAIRNRTGDRFQLRHTNITFARLSVSVMNESVS